MNIKLYFDNTPKKRTLIMKFPFCAPDMGSLLIRDAMHPYLTGATACVTIQIDNAQAFLFT
jgi:hypothetical protein